MATKGFIWYLAGGKHAVQLLVSLYSLRKVGHTEPATICIIDDDQHEAVGYAERLCSDPRLAPLDYKIVRYHVAARRKARQHSNKSFMAEWTPYDKTIFLDADTLVVRRLDAMWPRDEEVVLTQFATWVTTGHKMRRRLEQFRDVLPSEVALMLAHPYPAINTGTLAWDRDTKAFHQQWQTACAAKPVFMGDELTANLVFVNHPHRVLSHAYNYSPVYSTDHHPPEGIHCWHMHGQKHVRNSAGAGVWLPVYHEAHEANIAGLREWTPARDSTLANYLKRSETS